MHRAVSFVRALVGATLALGALGSCTAHSESGSGADGPPPSRLAAAPAPPHLSVASLASLPSSPDGGACGLAADGGACGLAADGGACGLAADGGACGLAADDQAGGAYRSCPSGMVLVDGDYCTEVREACAKWEDPPGTPLARCAQFAPSRCIGHRVHMRFCVDRDEYVRPGESLPLGDASWTDANAICRAEHKRLCKETEWELACEGEQMFPYTTGYDRNPVACNFDRDHLVDPRTGKLRDQRLPGDQLERCVSPFGVRNMNGNMDEWVLRDRTPGEWRSALKGGWWMAARERCRPATTAHRESFHELQTGVRCCAEAEQP